MPALAGPLDQFDLYRDQLRFVGPDFNTSEMPQEYAYNFLGGTEIS